MMRRLSCRARAYRLAGSLVVFFVFSSWFLASCLAADNREGPQLKAADAAFHAGYAAERRGDLSTAKQQFEKVVQQAPDIAEGHSALGSVLLQLGQYEPAIRELLRALALKAEDRTAQTNLAVAYEQSGDHDKSLALFQSLDRNALRPLPSGVVIFYIRALAATHQTDLAMARTQRAVAATPEDPALADTLGAFQAQRQEWNDAVSQFREAIRLDPTFGEAHLHLGVALMTLQRSSEAVQELTTAAELRPQSVLTQVELAKALVASGEIAKAVPWLHRALALNPSSLETKYQLALALQADGQEQEAIPLFEEVLAGTPKNAPALTNLGVALVQTGKSKEAIPLYQRALKETPADPLVHQDLGVAYLQTSDLEDAMNEFRAGLKLAPDAYELHYDLGLALKLKDDLGAATTELELAAHLNPSSPDPPYTLGILDMQRGLFDDATASLKIALRLRPDNADGWAILGSVYKQQNKLEEASDALYQAIELMPNQPGPHVTLARVLAQQGRTPEAEAERKKAADLARVAVNRQRATFAAHTGNMLLAKGQVTDAIERYQEAVSSDPSYVEGHEGLATALERAGRTAEAEAERRQAAQLEHGEPRLPAQ
jgi:protein O-GlcNAc transferase